MKMFVVIILVAVTNTLRAQSVSFSSNSTQRFDTHVVSHSETLYALSKTYHTSVEELLKLNPGITNNNLQEGKIIKVPIVKNETSEETGEKHWNSEHPIIHKVEHGETVYSISKKFNSDIASILLWNDLKAPTIKEGQNLVVGFEKPVKAFVGPMPTDDYSDASVGKNTTASEILSDSPEPPFNNKKLTSSIDEQNPNEATKSLSTNANEVKHDEKGIAVWTLSSYDEGNFYALHSTAPQGTVITVRNLMNNKTINVKVIGRLPATSDNENVLIRLSESAAKKLNVLDEKFLVEINYTAPDGITQSTN